MKKRKKIICIVISLIIVMAAAGYIYLRPYFKVAGRIDKLLNGNYEYTLDYKIDGTDLGMGDIFLNGNISGQKSEGVVEGDVSVENTNLLKVYGDKSGEVIFNVKPLLEYAIKGSNSSISKILKFVLGDTYISFDQIKEITGYEDVEKVKKAESFSFLFNKNTFKKVDRPEDADDPYLAKADFFETKYKGKKIIVGIPEDENKMYLQTNIDGVKLTVNASYEYKNVDKIKMPEANISNSTLNILKGVFEKAKDTVK